MFYKFAAKVFSLLETKKSNMVNLTIRTLNPTYFRLNIMKPDRFGRA